MPLECLAQEPLGSRQIPRLTKPELDGVAVAVDRAIEIPPLASDFDVCLVDMPLSGDGSLAPVELLQQQQRVMNGPAMNSRVIDGDASLLHHLLKISQTQVLSQVPANAEHDH